MSKSAYRVLFIFILFAIIAGGLYLVDRVTKRTTPVGRAMPAFALTSLNGNRISERDLCGKKYGLLLFSVDCRFCKDELAKIKPLIPAVSSRLPIIVASIDGIEDCQKITRDLSLPFDIYPNAKDLAKQLGVRSVPTIILVDARGNIAYIQSGSRNEKFLEIVFEMFTKGENLSKSLLRNAYMRHTNSSK